MKSTNQHTPGPWEIETPMGDETPWIVQAGAQPYEWDALAMIPTTGDGSSPHALANARLIAAAPELLEALREGLGQMPGFDDSYCEVCDRHAPKTREGLVNGPVPHRDGCAVKLMEAAIAKAEGAQ